MRRTPVQSAGGSATPNCTGAHHFDLDAWIRAGNDPALVPGREMCSQFWSRDGASAIPTNLSNAQRQVTAP